MQPIVNGEAGFLDLTLQLVVSQPIPDGKIVKNERVALSLRFGWRPVATCFIACWRKETISPFPL